MPQLKEVIQGIEHLLCRVNGVRLMEEIKDLTVNELQTLTQILKLEKKKQNIGGVFSELESRCKEKNLTIF